MGLSLKKRQNHLKYLNRLRAKPAFSQDVFERLWLQNLTLDELAVFFERPVAEMQEAVSRYEARVAEEQRLAEEKAAKKFRSVRKPDLLLFEDDDNAQEPQGDDPTLEQIKERAAAIRASWSEAETARRLGIYTQPFEISNYAYDGRSVSFTDLGFAHAG